VSSRSPRRPSRHRPPPSLSLVPERQKGKGQLILFLADFISENPKLEYLVVYFDFRFD
ncbi:hypothetical protein LINPERHAP2_LOCUS20038, partial [Linum perenne]